MSIYLLIPEKNQLTLKSDNISEELIENLEQQTWYKFDSNSKKKDRLVKLFEANNSHLKEFLESKK